ncbi:hypothetical protein V2G26_001211 [Clonostachys chloroleuca]
MDGYANEPAWRRMGNTYWRLRELKMTKSLTISYCLCAALPRAGIGKIAINGSDESPSRSAALRLIPEKLSAHILSPPKVWFHHSPACTRAASALSEWLVGFANVAWSGRER